MPFRPRDPPRPSPPRRFSAAVLLGRGSGPPRPSPPRCFPPPASPRPPFSTAAISAATLSASAFSAAFSAASRSAALARGLGVDGGERLRCCAAPASAGSPRAPAPGTAARIAVDRGVGRADAPPDRESAKARPPRAQRPIDAVDLVLRQPPPVCPGGLHAGFCDRRPIAPTRSRTKAGTRPRPRPTRLSRIPFTAIVSFPGLSALWERR